MWKYGTPALAALLCAAPLSAQVVRLEITSREPMSAGQPAGAAGPFELIRGRIHGEVDPNDPHNAIIQDLDLAPRNARRQSRVRRDLRTGQARRSREGIARAPLPGGQSRERAGDGERRGRHHARERLAGRCHPDSDQPEPRRSGRTEEGRLARDRPGHRPSLRSSRRRSQRADSPRLARDGTAVPARRISRSPMRR